MSLFHHAEPGWFTIPAHRAFVDDLARGLMQALGAQDPEAFSDTVILTPTRRGARALSQAFVAAANGAALLLPQVRALGDLEEGEPPFEPGALALDLPPAITPYRRRFELARLVSENAGLFARPIDAAAALELADALAAFLDSLQIEEAAGADGVGDLAPHGMARHWEISARFLALALEAWPQRLRTLGLIDVNQRRVMLLDLLTRQWRERPPRTPLIAAGSTGAAPATARLLAAIADAPQGAVVLPGLDLDLADDAWAKVDDQHPQSSMKRLLEQSEVDRDHVRAWPVSSVGDDAAGRWRRRLVNEALRPAEATADWLDQIGRIRDESPDSGRDPIALGLAGLTVVAGAAEEETAAICALLMRESLETPGKTCALITPDRDLARRISAKLARWGLEVESSAGTPLSHTPVGVLIDALAQAAAHPCEPVRLLAILKHPLARLGLADDVRAAGLEALERCALRGPRPADWDAVAARLTAKRAGEAAEAVLAAARSALDLLLDGDGAPAPPAARAEALSLALEALAADASGTTGALWRGPAGEAASSLLAALIEEGERLPEATADGFALLMQRLTASASVREGGMGHPRLAILGTIEARLVRADRLILAGLEEGVWPQGAPADPFLSRPMRKTIGLPSPERRVGLSAHDFAQAACAPEVYLVHSQRREGAPAVESRWLWRLKTLAAGAGGALPGRPALADWAAALDAPGRYTPIEAPKPAPPLAARPRELPVTGVETLTRDPYAVYARTILGLRQLNRPDEALEARARGTAIHAAFEAFARRWPDALPPDAADQFQALYLQALRDAGAPDASLAREQALAREAGHWVAEMEARRREGRPKILVEQKGTLTFEAAGGSFTLTARADRIELTPGGLAHVLDFKTGAPPSAKMVETGFSPQLTLTAAILAAGGFPAARTAGPGDLIYLRVTGRHPAGEEIVCSPAEETQEAAGKALAGLKGLVNRFDNPAQPYRSRTAPQFVKASRSDYDHLARVFEWSTGAEEETEA